MKRSMIGTLLSLGILAACSSVPSEPAQHASGVPQTYLLDGERYSPAAMERLAAQRTLYYVVTPEAFAQNLVYVFGKRAAADAFKRAYQPSEHTLSAQLLETKTKVYDGTNYNEDKLELNKGTVINDLRALIQPDGESWNNQISSLKAADGVWTDLYDYYNLDPNHSRWSTHGDNYKNLPSWIINDASSLEVGQ